MDNKAKRCLDVWIGQDKKIMTYRSLSRELGVSTAQAESILAEYYESHQSLHPTYLLSGTYLSKPDESKAMDVDGSQSQATVEQINEAQVSRAGMVVCKPDEVEAKTRLFDPSTASIKLYSLSPSETRDPSSLVLPFMTLLSHKAYNNPSLYGTVAFSSSTNGALKSKSALTAAAPRKSDVLAPAASTAKSTLKPGPKPTSGGSGTLGFSKAEPKITEPVKTVPPPSKPIKKPMIPIFSSDDESEAPIQKSKSGAKAPSSSPPSPPVAKPSSVKRVDQSKVAAQKKELEGLWDMDIDESKESPSGRGQKGKKRDISLEEESDMEEDSKSVVKRAAAKAPAKPKTSANKRAATPSAEVEQSMLLESEGAEKKKIRKVRRIIKTVTSTNKRGYEVTEDVSTDESYYSDESTDSRPKSQAKSKAIASANSKGRASAKVSRADIEDDEGSDEEGSKTKPPPAKKSKSSAPAVAETKPAPAKRAMAMATVGTKGKPPLKGQTSLAGFFSKK
ncbi:DNA polymerase subunit Cdc27 [Phaffia rhodozyma]|uniref:DNA polymerase delta subunit 3 n=1 Tax=Phaffia rhodozyma TaxID=264483 RepID=A0A0F7STV8_PHARH|nr:DNA polymerase subunit Cdc27 [Phaffia rhodozyma]